MQQLLVNSSAQADKIFLRRITALISSVNAIKPLLFKSRTKVLCQFEFGFLTVKTRNVQNFGISWTTGWIFIDSSKKRQTHFHADETPTC